MGVSESTSTESERSGQAAKLSFPIHARDVVRSLRNAFSELLTSVGMDPNDPQGMSRSMGLNKNLAWKISKIVQTDDPSVTLEQMPGSAGIRIFLNSVERAGARAGELQAARDAVEGYEKLIEIHSGDRATLEMMGSDLSPAGRQQRDEQHRKMLFMGSSYVWGVQARVMLKVGVVGLGRDGGTLDFASMSGLIDFRRLRTDVSWTMARRYWNNDDGSKMAMSRPEAVDLRYNGDEQAPLMADFCSKPLPELRRMMDGGGGTNFDLVEGPVGNTGALSCVVGTIQRGIPYVRTPENQVGEHTALCDTPAELMILDLLVHEKLGFAHQPRAQCFSRLRASLGQGGDDKKKLTLHEQIQDLGVSSYPPATPEVRAYGDMIRAVFDRTGWKLPEFRLFRMRIAYPVCPAALMLSYDLPDQAID